MRITYVGGVENDDYDHRETKNDKYKDEIISKMRITWV